MTRLYNLLFVAVVISFSGVSQVSGISMRHDVLPGGHADTTTANPFIDEAQMSLYSPVAFLNLGGGTGTGTLVPSSMSGEWKILTAAHNIDSDNNGTPEATSIMACFGTNLGVDSGGFVDCSNASSTVAAITSIAVHPDWAPGGAAQNDLAVLTFTTANTITGTLPAPMSLALSNPTVGSEIALAGHGGFGSADASFENVNPDGYLRAGRNNLDLIGVGIPSQATEGFILGADLDAPDGYVPSLGGPPNSMGTDTPLAREAGTATGDSGGPVINAATGQLLGVLNGGYPGSGAPVSEYGDVSKWAPVNEPSGANLTFITGAGVAAVPEPSAALFLGLVVVLVAGKRRFLSDIC